MENIALEEQIEAFPGLGGAATTLRNEFSLGVAMWGDFHFRLGYVLEFDSEPARDASGAERKKTDHRFQTMLVYKF